jgi:hypothetical protein
LRAVGTHRVSEMYLSNQVRIVVQTKLILKFEIWN